MAILLLFKFMQLGRVIVKRLNRSEMKNIVDKTLVKNCDMLS